jgi:hypothetical protein
VLTPYGSADPGLEPWRLSRRTLFVVNNPEPHECFQTDSSFSSMFATPRAEVTSNGSNGATERFLTADAFGVELPQSSQRQFAVVLLKRF